MVSLVHSKNVGGSTFKVNDSITHDLPMINHNSTEIFSGSHIRLVQPLIKKGFANSSLDHSFFSKSIGDNVYRPGQSQVYEITTLPTSKQSCPSPQISIANLYPSNDPATSMKHSRTASIIPEISLKVYKSISPRAGIRSPLDTSQIGSSVYLYNKTQQSHSKKSDLLSKTSTTAEFNKFDQYLKYLDAMNDHAPKDKFERRLLEKYSKNLRKDQDTSEPDSPSYKKMPLPFLEKGNSVMTASKDTPQKSVNFVRKSSIVNLRHTRILLRDASPTESQDSRNTLNEIRSLSPTTTLNNKKSVMVPTMNRMFTFGLTKQLTRAVSRTTEVDSLFTELAVNLQDLFQLLGNEQKMATVLNKLSQESLKVMTLILPKFHKVNDYEASKLEQKFATIEVITETLSIPMKLQKKKDGITLIEPAVLEELKDLNKTIEEYNVVKKREQLKLVEDRLVQSQANLQAFRHRKLLSISKSGKGMYSSNHQEKTVNISPTFSYDNDPMALVEDYQRNNDELKHLNKKYLEHGRAVNELFNKWMSQQNSV